jgi:short-subunit dehydrogenase
MFSSLAAAVASGLRLRRLTASNDYNVVAVARRESEDLARAIRETGADRLHFRPFDLSRIDQRHMTADGASRIVNISPIIASAGYNGLSVCRVQGRCRRLHPVHWPARSASSASP